MESRSPALQVDSLPAEPVLTKKVAQCERWELCFIWGKMSSSVQETAPQIALRDCSKEAVREGQYIKFWWRRSSMQSSAYFTKGFLLGTYITMKEFTNFSIYEEMQGLGSSPPWIPLRGCWRPEAIAAQGSVSTETNGKCPCWWSCVC